MNARSKQVKACEGQCWQIWTCVCGNVRRLPTGDTADCQSALRRNQRRRGLSLLEVVFVMVTLVLVGGLFLPRILRPKARGHPPTCTSNLKQVGLSYRLFANDHFDEFPFALSKWHGGTLEFTNSRQVFRHFQAMSNELVTPRILVCPHDMARVRGTNFGVFSNTNISYLAGLDAKEDQPQTILSGDRNITGGRLTGGFLRFVGTNDTMGWTKDLHNRAGNLGLGDGSVYETTAAKLNAQIQKQLDSQVQRLPEVRLAIP